MIYLLHFVQPHAHARHYLGYCEEGGLEARLERHRKGNGAKLLKVILTTGNNFVVARTWEGGTRDEERKLKRGNNVPRLCPICQSHKLISKLGSAS